MSEMSGSFFSKNFHSSFWIGHSYATLLLRVSFSLAFFFNFFPLYKTKNVLSDQFKKELKFH